MRVLEHLEPKPVFRFFEDLTQIPRSSRDTKAVSDFCVRFARQRGLRCHQDGLNNVVIYAPATPGYEAAPTVILQGHLDMVAVAEPDSAVDPAAQPLDVQTDGAYISARGTSLGGDDGIAVAMALAVLDDPSIPHPALEAVFTVDEEIGMDGARGLDGSLLSGRILLNIDSEDEGVLTVGCAGGATAAVTLPVMRAPAEGVCCTLRVQGLQGGHSGVEIHKGRANANILLGRVLDALQHQLPLRLVCVTGGSKDNAIALQAEASLTLDAQAFAEAAQTVRACMDAFRKEYAAADPGVELTLTQTGPAADALRAEDTARVIRALMLMPNGVAAMSMDIPGLVQTSSNLGILRTEADCVRATVSVRSSVGSQKQMLLARLRALAETLGGTLNVSGDYPAWEYRRDSALRDRMARIWQEQTGSAPKIEVIHAGLECGLFSGKLPGLDAVSFGPDLIDIHTTKEKMSVASVQRIWRYLLAVLADMRG